MQQIKIELAIWVVQMRHLSKELLAIIENIQWKQSKTKQWACRPSRFVEITKNDAEKCENQQNYFWLYIVPTRYLVNNFQLLYLFWINWPKRFSVDFQYCEIFFRIQVVYSDVQISKQRWMVKVFPSVSSFPNENQWVEICCMRLRWHLSISVWNLFHLIKI